MRGAAPVYVPGKRDNQFMLVCEQTPQGWGGGCCAAKHALMSLYRGVCTCRVCVCVCVCSDVLYLGTDMSKCCLWHSIFLYMLWAVHRMDSISINSCSKPLFIIMNEIIWLRQKT